MSLITLPNELQQVILLHFIQTEQDIALISLVCKKWYAFSQGEFLWRKLSSQKKESQALTSFSAREKIRILHNWEKGSFHLSTLSVRTYFLLKAITQKWELSSYQQHLFTLHHSSQELLIADWKEGKIASFSLTHQDPFAKAYDFAQGKLLLLQDKKISLIDISTLTSTPLPSPWLKKIEDTGKVLTTLALNRETPDHIAALAHNRHLKKASLHIIQAPSGKELYQAEIPYVPFATLSFQEKHLLCIQGENSALFLYKLELEKKTLHKIPLYQGSCLREHFHIEVNSHYLALGLLPESTLKAWDYTQASCPLIFEHTFSHPEERLEKISLKDHLLLSCHSEALLKIWSLPHPTCLYTLEKNASDRVRKICTTPTRVLLYLHPSATLKILDFSPNPFSFIDAIKPKITKTQSLSQKLLSQPLLAALGLERGPVFSLVPPSLASALGWLLMVPESLLKSSYAFTKLLIKTLYAQIASRFRRLISS